MTAKISFEVILNDGYDATFKKLSEALKAEGFGILTQIDVQKTLKEKIGVDFRRYAILGVCNPKLAHRALSHNAESGMLLPCNVTIESETELETVVRIIDPVIMLSIGQLEEDEILEQVGKEAQEKLLRVVNNLK